MIVDLSVSCREEASPDTADGLITAGFCCRDGFGLARKHLSAGGRGGGGVGSCSRARARHFGINQCANSCEHFEYLEPLSLEPKLNTWAGLFFPPSCWRRAPDPHRAVAMPGDDDLFSVRRLIIVIGII